MIVSLRNFYVLNQILMGRGVEGLNENLLIGLDLTELNKRIQTIKENNKKINLLELERVFLNFLRTPEYAAGNVNGSHVPLSKVAELCRKEGLDPVSCAGWLAKCVQQVEVLDYMAPATFGDGVLRLPEHQCKDDTIKAAVNNAFSLFVWGCHNPTKKQQSLVSRLLTLTDPKGSFAFKNSDLLEVVTAIADSGLSIDMLRSTVLNIPDLKPVFDLTGVLMWEDGADMNNVRLLVPKGKQDRAWATSVKLSDVITLVDRKLENFVNITSKGEYLTMTGVGA